MAVVCEAEKFARTAGDVGLLRVIQFADTERGGGRTSAFVGKSRELSEITVAERVVFTAILANQERARLVEHLDRAFCWVAHNAAVSFDVELTRNEWAVVPLDLAVGLYPFRRQIVNGPVERLGRRDQGIAA